MMRKTRRSNNWKCNDMGDKVLRVTTEGDTEV